MFVPSTSPITLSNPSYLYFNVQYGMTNKQIMEVWIPTIPVSVTPIVVYVHGGGFISGSTANGHDEDFISELIDNGVAYASIDYDLLETDVENIGVISCLESVKNAIQFLKYRSDYFNIDKNEFILKGSSGGAGASMWLAYQDDLADPSPNVNPIFQESTFIKAITLLNPQSTYDLLRWDDEVFSDVPLYDGQLDYNTNLETRKSTHRLFAIRSYQELIDATAYRASVDMIDFIDTQSPVETFISCINALNTTIVSNTILDIAHSPFHGKLIKEHLDGQSVPNKSYINGIFTDPSGETEMEFILRIFGL